MLEPKARGKSVRPHTLIKVNTGSAVGSSQGLCSKPELLNLFARRIPRNQPCGPVAA